MCVWGGGGGRGVIINIFEMFFLQGKINPAYLIILI